MMKHSPKTILSRVQLASKKHDETETSDLDDVILPLIDAVKMLAENQQAEETPNTNCWLLDNGTDVFLALKHIQELDGLGAGRNTITAAVTSLVYEMEHDLMQ